MTNAGWKAKIGLEEWLRETYAWFLENIGALKEVNAPLKKIAFKNRLFLLPIDKVVVREAPHYYCPKEADLLIGDPY